MNPPKKTGASTEAETTLHLRSGALLTIHPDGTYTYEVAPPPIEDFFEKKIRLVFGSITMHSDGTYTYENED